MPAPHPSDVETALAGNLLLASLEPDDRARLLPQFDLAEVRRGDLLFGVGDDVRVVSFPCHGTVAGLILVMRDGRTAEAATVGREGAIGGVVSQGFLPAFSQAAVQMPGPVLRIDAARLHAAKDASPPLADLFARYSDCLLAQILQSAACNALHSIEQRCARWLLTIQDRLGGDALPVTHEMLAGMLSVQRTYLTRVLSTLQDDGSIAVHRGRIAIHSREGLERASCECHATVRRHFEAVMGVRYPAHGTMPAPDRPWPGGPVGSTVKDVVKDGAKTGAAPEGAAQA